MSIRVMSAVWDLVLPDSEKLVALALADWCNDQGECWPSVAQIAKKCSKGVRTVQGVLASLESKGILHRNMVAGKGTFYRLDPRSARTPAVDAPPQRPRKTPAAAAPNTSGTINSKKTQGVREHEIPDAWQPAEFGPRTKSREIVDGWPPGELESQVEHFTAHHRSKGSKFKDWQDAWSTWVLNSRRFGGRNGSGNNNRQSGANAGCGRDGFINACFEAGAGQAAHLHAGDG